MHSICTAKNNVMPTSKNAQLRYLTLDRCLRNPGRRYFVEDLLEEVNRALYEFNGAVSEIKQRQLFDDLKFMESESGFQAPIKRTRVGKKPYYRYADPNFSITNQPLNEAESQQLREAILTLSRLEGMPQFEWVQELVPRLEQSMGIPEIPKNIISFDSNRYLKGKEWIKDLFSAIRYEKVLEIDYQPFKADTPSTLEIHPYHLRQYNNRWFLFGRNPEFENLTTLALDRILDLDEKTGVAYLPTTIDFEDYFEDIVGVTRHELPLEKIQLWISADLYPYIETKPLHGSQKRLHQVSDGTIIQLEVIPNHELKQLLRGFGRNIKVLEPTDFWGEEEVGKL